ncbi:raucaffricine-O-beta-D-glucosidase [Lactuca sativa]|uniref:raucaffricine-O-beta-D-glucosidase n=1 Tax=Lactuca sativa TaxID=4236 RepID=UPI000CB332A9|nr:raucaffricine-O-beta-D-glucosidase [Lactuca sativa]
MTSKTVLEFDHDDNMASNIKRHDFPNDFFFGVGSSAYQIEGGWRANGKGYSIWDCFCLRHPDKIEGGANACYADDNYSRIKEDVQLLKKMGVNSYRFSISWSRILPGGKVSMGKSMEGINHYNKLIDELLANDIKPFVTLFHWDLPNALEEEYMGFLSSKIVDDFLNYADICFWEFGDRVKNWVTINEPHIFTTFGYVQGQGAPGRGGENEDGDPQTEPYIVAYNILNCHAAAYRRYSEDYKDTQKGKVGITLNCSYFQPYRGDSYKKDVQAVKYAYDFTVGWFLEPLTRGTWPDNMEKFVATPSTDHPNGRLLPKFSTNQSKKLIDSYDFLGVNYYTAYFTQYQGPSDAIPLGYSTDCHYAVSGQDPSGNYIGEPSYQGSRVYLCPQQLTELLIYIKRTYNVTKDMIITENGSSDKNEAGKTYDQVRDDEYRIKYIKEHLKALRLARENNINVMGYFIWSFMDSFEWVSGYSIRFGMIYVDFMKDLQRYPKKSAIWFKKFLGEDKIIPVKRSITASEDEDNFEKNLKKAGKPIEASQKMKKART